MWNRSKLCLRLIALFKGYAINYVNCLSLEF